jgi:hypothetical protein
MSKSKDINKYLFIPNNKNLEEFPSNSFILPLEKYSIGFDVYFNVDEINKLSNTYNIYVMINKFLHKDDLDNIKTIIKSFSDRIKGYFIEDYGLINLIDKNKIILYPNHIINNYKSIKYISNIGINNIVVSNELTITELNEIRKSTNSKLYYNLITKNMIMYSKRKLVSNYYENYKIDSNKNLITLSECLKGKKLIIKEEDGSSVIFNNELFCANKYLDDLIKFDYLIINLSLLTNEETKIILNNYNSNKLHEMIECDYYFLENDIKYKIKDIGGNQ